ncbi:hypothetical protein [uncultured Halopseudomonas sp.]
MLIYRFDRVGTAFHNHGLTGPPLPYITLGGDRTDYSAGFAAS